MLDSSVFNHITYGVYVLTTLDRGRPVGCIVNSVMQVTAEPATMAVSLNHNNYSHGCTAESGLFAISILTEKTPASMIGTFGFQSSKDTNKFTGLSHDLKQGVPILREAFGYVLCRVVDTLETPTHTEFLGEVLEAGDLDTSSPPMTYNYYLNVFGGHSPINAPTYMERRKFIEKGRKTKWICQTCGFVHERETLPEGFICPMCGKTEFE
jgi:flavin reductase (DIM6/NTAB) family NADH-FMN oxidoreductase RutF